jgi:hypothetical protein
MPVYFVLDTNTSHVKIGRGSDVRRRVRNLQTGNPSPLQLMGWIEVENDNEVERRLHARYQEQRGIGEWFSIGPTEVLAELKSENGFVPTPKDAFEIVGYDRDGIPEYMGVCEWADFEFYECCPFCGCFCGMHFQEASGMYHCMNCDAFTNFEDLKEGPYDVT